MSLKCMTSPSVRITVTHSHTRLLNRERKQTWSQWRWRCGDLTSELGYTEMSAVHTVHIEPSDPDHSKLPRNMYLWVYMNTNMPYPQNTLTLTFTTQERNRRFNDIAFVVRCTKVKTDMKFHIHMLHINALSWIWTQEKPYKSTEWAGWIHIHSRHTVWASWLKIKLLRLLKR